MCVFIYRSVSQFGNDPKIMTSGKRMLANGEEKRNIINMRKKC